MSGYTSNVDSTPMFVPGSFDGQDVRLATIGNAQPGLFAPGDFAVSQRAAGANMSVDIAAGRAYLNPVAVALQGSYLVWRGSTYNTSSDGGYTWTAADPTNPRIDLLCIEVADTDFSGSYTGWKWRIVDGTPNAGATAVGLRQYWPSIPAGCLVVAAVRIPATATTITTANILNLNEVGGPMVAGRTGVQTFAGTGTIQADRGRVVTFSGAASQTITLPTAAVGMEFEVHNIDASDAVTLTRGGSDTFADGATTSLVIPAGGRVTVRCVATGVWRQSWPTGQTLAAGTAKTTIDQSGAGDFLSVTLAGDGTTPVRLEAECHIGQSGAAAGTNVQLQLRTASGGGGTLLRNAWVNTAGSGYASPVRPSVVVAAFAGSATFYGRLTGSGGTPTEYAGTVASPATLRAMWAPGEALT